MKAEEVKRLIKNEREFPWQIDIWLCPELFKIKSGLIIKIPYLLYNSYFDFEIKLCLN